VIQAVTNVGHVSCVTCCTIDKDFFFIFLKYI